MTTANARSQLDKRLRDAFREIIDGKTVKRSRHELTFGGIEVPNIFIDELEKKNFLPATVAAIPCLQGERVPAFVVEDSSAYFGWIFWEKFSERRLRKLFGSVVKDDQGKWAVQVPENSQRVVYANAALKIEMDIDHPFEL
ncbi:MAG TPA: hypothetical protein VMG34_14150 [Bacteroidota bacterium]|nr:hypothetical protein [Bacteroidota bacterium]